MNGILRTVALILAMAFLFQGCAVTLNGIPLPLEPRCGEPTRRRVGDKKEIDITWPEVILVLSVPVVLAALSIGTSIWIANELDD